MKNKILLIFLLCLFSSCLGFDVKEKVIDNYYLIAVDAEEQMDLSYCDPADNNGCIGIIEPTVFAVGYDMNYIIAKQHPLNKKDITNYFILPINNKNRKWGDNFGLIGPLTLNQFDKAKKDLNILDSIDFSILKKDLF
jgi:hypothetical protein